jgi:hypothetical protein
MVLYDWYCIIHQYFYLFWQHFIHSLMQHIAIFQLIAMIFLPDSVELLEII